MNHRTARKLVGLLVAIALCSTVIVAPVGAATIPSITVTASSLAAGATSVSYTYNFTLPGGLAANEAVTITFPSGFDVSQVKLGTVTCYGGQGWSGSVDSVNVSGQNVIVSASSTFANNESVTITLLAAGLIANPSFPGVYPVSVSSPLAIGSTSITIGMGSEGSGSTGTGGVTSVSAIVETANAGKAMSFSVTFETGSDGALVGAHGDYVDITFPAGTTLPSTIPSGTIIMKTDQVTSMQVNGMRLRLYLPANDFIAAGAQCTVMVLQSAGILHPGTPGTYSLQVSTSRQPNASTSNTYLIVGTAVLNASVAVNPAQQGTVAQYQVTFSTSLTGALSAGTDLIYVDFPTGTTIPATIAPSSVLVNNVAARAVQTLTASKLGITVSGAVAGGSTVQVILGTDCGIRNPAVVGSHQLNVSTSQDTMSVAASFTLSSSQIGTPTVQVSNSAAGQAAGYTVAFTTGPGGALTAGIDRVNIDFPSGTTIPQNLTGSTVTVNGVPSTLVTSAGMILGVTIPAAMAANTMVTIAVGEAAGISNPVTGGTYTVRISTSQETVAVTSNGYAISALPTVRATVQPASPDGEHGFYRTKPSITLSAVSAIDAQPVITYHFDSDPDTVYSDQPFAALEGSHALTFAAVDRLGNQSVAGVLTLSVDTIPPVIAILEPLQGATLNGQTFAVRGTVDVGSAVTVNGQSAVVDPTGAFNQTVTIPGITATIVVEARDLAGNTSQQMIQVTVDKVPPTLTIAQPVNFQKVQRLPIVVQGKTEAGSTVTVQGDAATVLADGSFEYSIASATDGPLTIAVIARDAAGNTTTRTVAVTVMSTKMIRMQIGADTALVNEQPVSLQTAPIIRNGTTLVPLRFVAETFGITPSWDGVFQIIDLPVGSHAVRLQIGQLFAGMDGKRVVLDAAPIIQGSVTLVPLRFIADIMGADTQWEAATRTIIIIYPKAS